MAKSTHTTTRAKKSRSLIKLHKGFSNSFEGHAFEARRLFKIAVAHPLNDSDGDNLGAAACCYILKATREMEQIIGREHCAVIQCRECAQRVVDDCGAHAFIGMHFADEGLKWAQILTEQF